MKKTKLAALIIAIVVVVLGASAGVMYAFGVFSSDKGKAFDLLKQVPEKISHSATGDYIGALDMTKAMLDQGMDASVKYSNIQADKIPESTAAILSKLEFTLGVQLDFNDQKVRFDVGAGTNEANLALQSYASLADQKLALAVPGLIDGKVFTLTGSEDDEQAKKLQELIKHLTELKDSFKEYMDKQGRSVYDGITCETIENGYRLTIPKDVADSTINSLSEYVKEQKDHIESLEEAFSLEKGSVAAKLDEVLPQLTSATEDFSFEVYGDRGKLTGLKADIKDESGNEILVCNLEFTEDGNQSSFKFTADMKENGTSVGRIEIGADSTDGDTCEDKMTYKVNIDDEIIMDSHSTIAINKSTNELTVTGGSGSSEDIKTEYSGKGSIKNLTKGKCVTYQFDQFDITEEVLGETLKISAALEVTEGVHDGEVTAPQGEEVKIDQELINTFADKYAQEMYLSFMTIMTKWGIDFNDLLGTDFSDGVPEDDYEYEYDDSLTDVDSFDDGEITDEEALIS